jgi:hypothetical protein
LKRKITYLLLIFLLTPVIIFSQDLSAGLKAGINIIPLEKNDLKGNLLSPGYNIGGVFQWKVNDFFSLGTEVSFTTRKKTYETNSSASFVDKLKSNFFYDLLPEETRDLIDSLIGMNTFINDKVYNKTTGAVSLGYIEIPIIARFHYKSLSIATGPFVSFLVSGKVKEELTQSIPLFEAATFIDTIPFFSTMVNGMFPGYSKPYITEEKTRKNLVTVDYGFIADISYRINENFNLGIRYTRGLTNYRSPIIYDKDYLSSFSFSVSYMFNFSVKQKSKSMLGH